MNNDVELQPHCYYCGSKECIDGRFLTFLCPKHREDREGKAKENSDE